jgi:organic radical activating enzyme
MISKQFPIKSETACLLKWAWSSVYVYQGTTNSCHRIAHDQVDDENFGMFHNSSGKLKAREKMLNGEWPGKGCEYCRDIEAAGGVSDRVHELTTLDTQPEYSKYIPPELLTNPSALSVTPTMVELYFSNKCNMSCIYCDPSLSSLWVAENRIHGDRGMLTVARADELTSTYDIRLEKFWAWFKENYKTIKLLHVLGGEPFYQEETDQMIDFLLESDVTPGTTIKFFSNLKVNDEKFKRLISKMKRLVDEKHMIVGVTASLDAWGPDQEYVRSGLVLKQWEQNFEYMVNTCPWLELCVNSTINCLSIKSMPKLIEKLNAWRVVHPNIVNSFNLLVAPTYMDPGNFPAGYFKEDMQRILDLMPRTNIYEETLYNQMQGVFMRIENTPHRPNKLDQLKQFLDLMDSRKKTNWRTTFPWLIKVIDL